MEQLTLFPSENQTREFRSYTHLPLDVALQSLDIIDVGLDLLSDVVKKRKISPNYRGLCPFHVEKTPSFHLVVKHNCFKCHGCDISGKPLVLPFYLMKHTIRPVRNFIDPIKYLEIKVGFDINNSESRKTLEEALLKQKRINWRSELGCYLI